MIIHICIPISKCPGGGIGRRVGLKHQCLRTCRFDSGPGYYKASINSGLFFITTMDLTHQEKLSHLQDLIHLSKSDESIVKIEAVYIQKVAKKLGISDAEIAIIEFKGIDRALPKNEFQIIPLFHRLIILMMIDSKIHDDEIKFCSDLGIKMGLHPQAVGDIIELAKTGHFEYMDPDRISAIFKKYYN